MPTFGLIKIVGLLHGQPQARAGAERSANPQAVSGVIARRPTTIS